MKVYLRGSFIFSALILIFTLVFVFMSLGYSRDARVVPFGLGIAIALMTIFVLVGERYPILLRRFGGILEDLEKKQAGAESRPEPARPQQTGKKFLIICAWIFGFYLLVFLVGFLIAIPVFIIAFLKARRISWITTIIITVLVSAFAWGGFQIGMRADFFEGIIFGGIVPPL